MGEDECVYLMRVALPDRPDPVADEDDERALPGVLTSQAEPRLLQQSWVLWVGALIVGLLDAYGRWLLPEFSYFVLFGPMALLLLFRPTGLFGKAH